MKENDPEQVTDEMMDEAYMRYIQAAFIKMNCEEALEKTRKECDRQLFEVFSATEDLRQKVIQKKKDALMSRTVANLSKVLTVVREKISIEEIEIANEKLALIASGLEDVKHHLQVQGLDLEDQEAATKELEKMNLMFSKVNKNIFTLESEMKKNTDLPNMALEYNTVVKKSSEVNNLVRNCLNLLKEAEKLANHEASLKYSFHRLEKVKAMNIM